MKSIFQEFLAGWKEFANRLGRINTIVLVTLFYFLILAPLGAVFRLFGWDPLSTRGFRGKKQSNWRNTPRKSQDLESLRRQS